MQELRTIWNVKKWGRACSYREETGSNKCEKNSLGNKGSSFFATLTVQQYRFDYFHLPQSFVWRINNSGNNLESLIC
jgi:hypothetical protein